MQNLEQIKNKSEKMCPIGFASTCNTGLGSSTNTGGLGSTPLECDETLLES
jgi:hypothetical protein